MDYRFWCWECSVIAALVAVGVIAALQVLG